MNCKMFLKLLHPFALACRGALFRTLCSTYLHVTVVSQSVSRPDLIVNLLSRVWKVGLTPLVWQVGASDLHAVKRSLMEDAHICYQLLPRNSAHGTNPTLPTHYYTPFLYSYLVSMTGHFAGSTAGPPFLHLFSYLPLSRSGPTRWPWRSSPASTGPSARRARARARRARSARPARVEERSGAPLGTGAPIRGAVEWASDMVGDSPTKRPFAEVRTDVRC